MSMQKDSPHKMPGILWMVLMGVLLSVSCQHVRPRVEASADETALLQGTQRFMEAQKWEEAEKELEEFFKLYPNSVLRTQGILLQAHLELAQKQWGAAVETLKDVKARARNAADPFFVEAALLQAKAWHLLNDPVRSRAALLEAEAHPAGLGLELRVIQLPLIGGLIRYAAGETAAAELLFKKARKGLDETYGTDMSNEVRRKRAQVFLQISEQALPKERARALKDFHNLQVFAIKGIEENDPEISQQIRALWIQKTEAWWKTYASPTEREDLLQFLELVQDARSQLLPAPAGSVAESFRRDVVRAEKRAQKLLLTWSGPKSMTPEAESRNREEIPNVQLVPIKK